MAWTSLLGQGAMPQHIDLIAPTSEFPANSAPFRIIALASSYLPVTLSVQGPATLDGRILTLTGTGTIRITASQAGNAQYAPATAELTLNADPIAPQLQVSSITVPYGTSFAGSLLSAAAVASPFVDPSADAATIAGQLNTSQLGVSGPPVYLPDSPVFRYENNLLTPTLDPNAPGGYSSNALKPPYALPYRAAFTCDCSQFEAVVQARKELYRVWVDGKYTAPDAAQAPDAYPARDYILVRFPDKRRRQIKFYVESNASFFGVNTVGGDTIAPPEVPLGDRVMIFGDSWTGPTILPPALPPAQPGTLGGGYPAALGEYFNWDYWGDGVGGSGFTNPGTDALGRTFVERAKDDICPYDFKAVVLLGGTNDGNAAESAVEAGASALFNELRSCRPDTPIYFYGPQDDSHPQVEQAFVSATASAGGQVSYTDMAGATPWFYGNSTDPSTGNDYAFLNGHPTPLGHDYLAEQIVRDLLTRYPALQPSLHVLSNPAPVAGKLSYSVAPGTLLPVGATPISLSFMPDDTAHYTAATASGMVMVTQAGTAVRLSTTQGLGTVAVTAVVSPQIAGVPTGVVTFMDNGTVAGAIPLAGGTASITIEPGAHSITATYGGDGNFVPSSSGSPLVLAVSKPDFALALDQPSVVVAPSTSASVRLNISPAGGLTGPVTLACAGLPANTTCSFAPASLIIGSTPAAVTVTIQASAARAGLQGLPLDNSGIALCSLTGMGFLWRSRRKAGTRLLLLVIGAGLLAGMQGCGASANRIDTAPGQYPVQIQATANAGTAAMVTHSQPLLVQVP